MEFIAHRINTITELQNIPKDCGVEIDIRPWSLKDLILAHDPFTPGEKLDDFLNVYDHGTLILNIKSERIEHQVIDLLKKHNITNYFFLDSSLPMINLLAHQGSESNMAIRFSEIEPIESLIPHQGKVKWVWVDCFTKFILTKELEEKIHGMGFKICLVSPELRGREKDIEQHLKVIKDQKIAIDAVCSKIHLKHKWIQT
jgi:hypothetical protein